MLRANEIVTASLLLAAGGCDRDIIDHSNSGEQVGNDDGANDDGNFPEPVQTQCGTLPNGVAAIPELASAHVAVPASDPGGDWRIRVGSLKFTCDQSFQEEPGCGAGGWAFAFSLPLEMITPGVHQLGDAPDLRWEFAIHDSGGPDGCAGGVGGGMGPGPAPNFVGEVEFFSMQDGCLVGELRNVDLGVMEPMIDPNGGFVAKTCETDCVPDFESCL